MRPLSLVEAAAIRRAQEQADTAFVRVGCRGCGAVLPRHLRIPWCQGCVGNNKRRKLAQAMAAGQAGPR